jgi:hypothetical protein
MRANPYSYIVTTHHILCSEAQHLGEYSDYIKLHKQQNHMDNVVIIFWYGLLTEVFALNIVTVDKHTTGNKCNLGNHLLLSSFKEKFNEAISKIGLRKLYGLYSYVHHSSYGDFCWFYSLDKAS